MTTKKTISLHTQRGWLTFKLCRESTR